MRAASEGSEGLCDLDSFTPVTDPPDTWHTIASLSPVVHPTMTHSKALVGLYALLSQYSAAQFAHSLFTALCAVCMINARSDVDLKWVKYELQ